ncbi:MAG TPA: FAD-binding oxidoreductase [Xanthobacteraceae bacterium]|nr:FAD-binding oxidoreductase [Xanthobacteraceae bacterium]
MSEQADRAAYGGSWYAATMLPVAARPPLAVDLDVDVCVVGGGLAGLTTAREVARRGWSVALLEGGRLAGSASGRNTGFVLPGFAADAEKIVARVGFEHAKDLWALAQAGLDYVRDTIAAEGADGIDPEPGWLYVSKTDDSDDLFRTIGLLGDLGCEVEGWPTERVRAFLRSERYFGAIHFLRAISIHPLNYALKLAAAAERDGARIFEDTPALAIDPTGVRKRISTPAARVRASHVVLAGNVQLKGLLPRVAATLVPITTYIITTAPIERERLTAAVNYRGAVSDTDLADNHYRIVGGDRLMWSGRATVWQRNPLRYRAALTADIAKTYPRLGRVEVEHAWNGTLGNTVHRMPQIGELGPGVWLASGFGGHGLDTTAMAGNIVARAIVEGDETWRKFTPFELVWAGGIFGRAAAQLRVWTKRLTATAAERRAKAREVAQRGAGAAQADGGAPEAAPSAPIVPRETRIDEAPEPQPHDSQRTGE